MIRSEKLYRYYVLSGLILAITVAPANCADEGFRPSPEQIAFIRDTCTSVTGIQPGIFPFDACVDSLSGILSGQKPNSMVSKVMPGQLGKEKSYFESNFDERRQKRENSCARLGIVPGVPGFGDCVARLNAALQYTIE